MVVTSSRPYCFTSPTMPTISYQSGLFSVRPNVMRLPMGSSLGNTFFTIVSLITATCAASVVSLSVNVRARQQHQRRCDFQHDQRAANELASPAFGRTAPRVFHRLVQIRLG